MEKLPWFSTRAQMVQTGVAVLSLLTGATVLAAITGVAQRVTGIPLDWWVLGSVFVGGLCVMWWVSTVAKNLANERLHESEMTASALPLKLNQVVYPSSKNGVLWEWSSGTLIGPSCPTHRVLLLYDPVHGTSGRTASFKDDDYLSANANFVCPIDDEEFIFIRLAGMKVGSLRTLALAQFQAEQERRRITEK